APTRKDEDIGRAVLRGEARALEIARHLDRQTERLRAVLQGFSLRPVPDQHQPRGQVAELCCRIEEFEDSLLLDEATNEENGRMAVRSGRACDSAVQFRDI